MYIHVHVVLHWTDHERVMGAPVSESQPQVVQPHPQLSHSQAHHLERDTLLATGQWDNSWNKDTSQQLRGVYIHVGVIACKLQNRVVE